MADWAALPYDLIVLITKHVKPIEDYIAFGSVCTSWRAAATKENFDVLYPQAPLLMLVDEKDPNYQEFYSLSNEKIVSRIFLPEARARSWSTSHGWLLVEKDFGEYSLLHPFSRAQIHLPLRYDEVPGEYPNICQAVLSGNPSLTSDYVLVMVSYDDGFNVVASWRPGDLKWTLIDYTDDDLYVDEVDNMMYYKGQFYAVYCTREVWVFNVVGPSISQPRMLISLNDFFDVCCPTVQFYLVEVSSVLLLLVSKFFPVRDCDMYSNCMYSIANSDGTSKFEVYELDVIEGELKEINTLGESAIFLDRHGASSVDSTRVAGVKPNHIYLTFDSRQRFEASDFEKYIGAYNLEDGKVEPYRGLSIGPCYVPTWVSPSFS